MLVEKVRMVCNVKTESMFAHLSVVTAWQFSLGFKGENEPLCYHKANLGLNHFVNFGKM